MRACSNAPSLAKPTLSPVAKLLHCWVWFCSVWFHFFLGIEPTQEAPAVARTPEDERALADDLATFLRCHRDPLDQLVLSTLQPRAQRDPRAQRLLANGRSLLGSVRPLLSSEGLANVGLEELLTCPFGEQHFRWFVAAEHCQGTSQTHGIHLPPRLCLARIVVVLARRYSCAFLGNQN